MIKLSPTLLLLAAMGSIPAVSFGFTDTFISGTPADNGWYVSATGSTLDTTGGDLRFTNGASAASYDAAFRQFSAVTLTDGQSLTLSFTYSASSMANLEEQFGVALFNSSNSFASNQANNAWTSGSGYQLRLNTGPASDTGNSSLRNVSFGTAGHPFRTTVTIGTTTATDSVNQASGTFSLTIARTSATSIAITSVLDGNTLYNAVDTGTQDFSTFNTLALGIGTVANSRYFEIDNVSMSVVPEPSSAAMLAGLGALGMVGLRRRRR
jgi:hypothetical protein